MNYFLILIIMGICAVGYYGYIDLQKAQQEKVAADQQQITDLGGKLDELKAENKKLEAEKIELAKSLQTAETEMTDLTAQVQAAQKAADAAKTEGAVAKAAAPAAAPAPPSNALGTITMLDGKTYPNCKQLKIDEEGVTISCDSGITKLMFTSMSPDLQKRFGFSPP